MKLKNNFRSGAIFNVLSSLTIFATSVVRNPPRHQVNSAVNAQVTKPSDINPIRTRFSSISYGSVDSRPTLNYQMALPSSRIGNFLGFYFEALSCASIVGMHFKANNDGQLIAHFERFVNSQIKEDRIQTFVSALPHSVEISSPSLNQSFYLDRMKTYCQCDAFCYQYYSGAWRHKVDMIGSVFTNALANVLWKTYEIPMETILLFGSESLRGVKLEKSKNVEIITQGTESATSLRLIPDTTLHVRCSDIMVIPDQAYGFLPFEVYKSLIPPATKLLYILSDSHHRANEGAICKVILTSLMEYLTPLFPSTSIVLIRGGSQLTSMTQMVFSNVTVCSASTFCFWPALASNNTVYYPLTSMILNGTTPKLTSQFHWITKDITEER